jgi:hypothetical protein
MSVRKLLITVLLLSGFATAQEMLMAWTGKNAPEFSAAGVSGSLIHPDFDVPGVLAGLATNVTSTDGTYGTLYSGAPAVIGAYALNKTDANMLRFTIVNRTGKELVLNTISFDYGKPWAAGPTGIALSYVSGGLSVTAGTVIRSITMTDFNGKPGSYDFPDFDCPLTGLADCTLADGESATFQLKAVAGPNATGIGFIDNLAISGTAAGAAPVTLGMRRPENLVAPAGFCHSDRRT